MDVDPVDQGTADLHVPLDLRRRAMAAPPRVAPVAARARIQGRNQHEVSRKRCAVQCSGDRYRTILQRLAHFERLPGELGRFIEEQHRYGPG